MTTTLTVREILRRIDIFGELSEEELSAVERCIERKSAASGELLVREGEASEELYIIETGEVCVFREAGGDGDVEAREEVKLATLGAGKCFGEMSLLDDLPPSASVRSTEDCELLAIGRLDLNVLLNWDTILAAKMWRTFARMLSRRLRDANDLISSGTL